MGEFIGTYWQACLGLAIGGLVAAGFYHFVALERVYGMLNQAFNQRDAAIEKFRTSESLAGAALDELGRLEMERNEL